jgi:hypothetical protein
MNGNSCVLGLARRGSAALFAGFVGSLFAVAVSPGVARAQSADFDQDSVVGPGDAQIFMLNFQQFGGPGGGIPGDADGDGYVGLLCDSALLLHQWDFGSTGSTATVAGAYDPATGLGSVTVTPSGMLGVSAIYLVNVAGTITTGPALGGTIGSDFVPGPVPPHGYGAAAHAASFWSGPNDGLGGGLVPAIVLSFTVPAATPITDLEFFYQRTAQGANAIPLLNAATGQTYVTTGMPPCGVPEPSGAGLGLASCLALRLWSRSRSRGVEHPRG